MTFGQRVIDWVLRHRDAAVPVRNHDLVLLLESPALEGSDGLTMLRGEPWTIRHVSGEITLRAALSDVERLVAVVPLSFSAPADLAGRAWFGRPLAIQARDVVAAASGRFCGAVSDEALAGAVLRSWDQLRDHALGWSREGPVTLKEIRDVLLSLRLGTSDRLDRVRADELLANWLTSESPPVGDPVLGAALSDSLGREGRWLAWALGVSDGLSLLVTAGALAGGDLPSELAQKVPSVDGFSDRAALGRLVEAALRQVHSKAPARVTLWLTPAEGLAAQVPPDHAERFPLLRTPLLGALERHLTSALRLDPADDARIDSLGNNLFAREHDDTMQLVRGASRLARFVAAFRSPGASSIREALMWARANGAWGDFALREVRRLIPTASPQVAGLVRTVITDYLRVRDDWNSAFATRLASSWEQVTANKLLRDGLPVHQISRCVLGPLLGAGHRVLLMVLDGCDLSSFYELLSRIPPTERLGLTSLPSALSSRPDTAELRTQFSEMDGYAVAVAAVPTVTNHSRRAIFAGDIPRATALDETESLAANASNDRTAFSRNPAFEGVAKLLLLKPDLDANPGALRTALSGNSQLVAVVFNAVDDALSSHETSAMGPWAFGSIGPDLIGTLTAASDQGWLIVVTADHGHTPFVEAGRRVAPAALGSRYGDVELPGAVKFDRGPLPRSPLWCLSGVGTWAGGQRQGWHGGASLEEVAVPLAILGTTTIGDGRPIYPGWWWRSDVARPHVEVRSPVSTKTTANPAPTWLDHIDDTDVARVLKHIAEHGAADQQDLIQMLGSDRAARRFANQWESFKHLIPFSIRVEMSPSGKRYSRDP